jgi:hypothetical protein
LRVFGIINSLDFTFAFAQYAHFAATRNPETEIEIGVGPQTTAAARLAILVERVTIYGDIRVWLTSFDAAAEHAEATPTTATRRVSVRSFGARRGEWAAGVGAASSGVDSPTPAAAAASRRRSRVVLRWRRATWQVPAARTRTGRRQRLRTTRRCGVQVRVACVDDRRPVCDELVFTIVGASAREN